MNILQITKLVANNLRQNKLRAFLTMLGIIIGVGAVIAMVSLIQSFIDEQMKSFDKMGINNISLTINAKAPDVFDYDDALRIVNEHRDVFAGITQESSIYDFSLKHGDEVNENGGYTNLKCIDENNVRALNQKIKKGRDISYYDVLNRNQVCIVGNYIREKMFKKPLELGDDLYINGVQFKIIGFLDSIVTKGDQKYTVDNCVYIPISLESKVQNSDAEDSVNEDGMYISNNVSKNFQFVGKDSSKINEATNILRKEMMDKLHDKKLFTITDFSSMLGEVNKIRSLSGMVAAGIGSISLLVAGIGIMNIMLVSVTERTREIGIRKSLGAKKSDIRKQFILEAGITGGIGGVIGIILGVGSTTLIGLLMKIDAKASITTILISFGVSVGVGMLFGFLPANKAAKLNPIDALRSE